MSKLSVKQQANRVLKWYRAATKQQVIEGMHWYNDAHVLASTLAAKYGISVLQVAQVISVLSPQKKWEQNKKETVALIHWHFTGDAPQFGLFATASTIAECHDILRGDFLIPARRTKTYSFADNIAYLGNSTEITIDRHALRVCYDDVTTKIDKVGVNDYKFARQAYQQVADSLGIKAYQLQAITWVTYKQFVNR